MSLQNKLNKAIRNFGQNVTLDLAENKKEFKDFRLGLKQSIREQVKVVTDDQEFVDQLINLTFKAEPNVQVVRFLDRRWLNLGAVFDKLKKPGAFLVFFIWAANVGGQSGLDKMGVDKEFNLTNDAVIRGVVSRANLLINTVDETTKETIAKLIEDGKQGLLTNAEITQLIDESFDNISKFRAETIARTELANAVSTIELETMRRSGVQRKRWITVLDDRVSERDRPMHGQEVGISADFVSPFDGWTGQSPPSHPNCRCFIEEVITGIEPDKENRLIWTGN